MAFHLYDINELFSNASGSIQFIELRVGGSNGESFWSGQTITVTQAGETHTFTFSTNLPSTQTANTSVLLATQGFANLGLVTPNYIIPDGFLFTSGGATVNFGGGADTVNYLALPTDGRNSIDRAGTQQVNSPTNFAGQTGSVTLPALNPIVGTAGADTLNGTAGADDIDGLAGRDTLKGNGGDDLLDGGSDIDTALYSGNRAGYTVGAAGATVSGGSDGSDTLANIERVRFEDAALAFDLNSSGAAASTAKLLGAVFGAASVGNKVYAGIGIALFDSGETYAEVADLAIHAALGQTIDNAALVRLLYTNVVGSAPSDTQVNEFVTLLNVGVFTQVSLTTFAADYELNVANVNLTGLAQTGLEYLPFPG